MKKLVVLFLGVFAVLTLSACGGAVDIGIVLPTNDEPRWVQDEERFEALLDETDYSVEILFSDGDTAVERSNVESLVAQGIKVLIITAQDGDAAAAAVEHAKAEGVTVIAYDRLITNTDAVDYYVTFDSIAVGEAQAQYLVDNATGTGNPLYLYAGAASDNNAFLFFEGAWNVLQPKIADGTFELINSSEAVNHRSKAALTRDELADIIDQVTTNWDFNEAINKAEAHLTEATADEKGDVFILAPNDGTARSIADTFLDDNDVSSIVITGQDAERASIQYIIDDIQSMTVFKDVRILVEDAMTVAVDVLEANEISTTGSYDNGSIDVPSIQTDVIVVDRNNVLEVIFDSGYYDEDDFDNIDDLN